MWVGGTPALEQDSVQTISAKLPLMVVILIGHDHDADVPGVRTLVLPIRAAMMSALTHGRRWACTWIFVDGHVSEWLNFTPTPLTAPVIGLIIAVI